MWSENLCFSPTERSELGKKWFLAKYFQLQIWRLVCSLLSLFSLTSSVSFESHQCPCPPTLHFCAYYHCFVYHFLPWCACHAYMMPNRRWGYFSLATASVGARVFSRLARSRKINLTVPSNSASWPISAIHCSQSLLPYLTCYPVHIWLWPTTLHFV